MRRRAAHPQVVRRPDASPADRPRQSTHRRLTRHMAATIELYLVRHAIAAERGPNYPDDRERPLTSEGIARFKRRSPGPEGRSTSSSTSSSRARWCARVTRRELLAAGLAAKPRDNRDRSAGAGRPDGQVLDAVAKYSKRYAAHRAGRPRAGSRRARRAAAALRGTIEFKKGAVCCIDLDGAMPTGPGTLRWLLPPKALRALAPERARCAARSSSSTRFPAAAGRARLARASSSRSRCCRRTTSTPTFASDHRSRRTPTGFRSEGAAANVDLVIAWGGDGTVNEAACALAGTNVPLAIVPGGSGNGLARDLVIPFDPAAALTIAATGMTRSIDAGELHDSLFFNIAGIGFDARIAARPGRARLRGVACSATSSPPWVSCAVISRAGIRSTRSTIMTARRSPPTSGPAGAVHRARELTSVRQRRADRAARAARRRDDRDRRRRAAVDAEHHAAGAGVFPRHAARRPRPADAIGGVDGNVVRRADSVSRRRRAAHGADSHRACALVAVPSRSG